MESPSIFQRDKKRTRGFTLLEVLVVLAIITMIIGFGLALSLNSYKNSAFRSEQSIIVSILEKARSRAVNNLYQTSHGVCYIAPNYIIFRGTLCAAGIASNELIEANPSVSTSGLSTTSPIVFDQLSGNLLPRLSPDSGEVVVTLIDGGRASVIRINNEGTITW